ncbi:MAG: FAD-dependent oxidoreductase [Dehalococcoidales bacterium]|nr:FAD-dependent oxidoreductase [Dehalococcoidales bacterium]
MKERESDIVIVGYGSAGAAAAIEARETGSEVLILEKTKSGGGNSLLSGGLLFLATGPGAFEHVRTLCFGKTDDETIRAYTDGCAELSKWIHGLGGTTEPLVAPGVVQTMRMQHSWPNVPGVEDTDLQVVPGQARGEGIAAPLWRLLLSSVEKRGIEVMTGTRVIKLVRNSDGRITGVIAEQNGETITVNAKKAVILTCGGFEYNDAMKDTYLPLTPVYPLGHPGNTGDGVKMTWEIGAAMWHMSQFFGWFVFKAPEYKTAFSLRPFMPNFIYVDKSGRRFTNESGWESHEASKALLTFMPDRMNYPCLPAYAIFDDKARRRGPISPQIGARPGDEQYVWSLDNSKEISKGWIKRGKTIKELAKQISMDTDTLENTIAAYNRACSTGHDTDFGRSKASLGPIEEAPFYAIEIWPGIGTTCGGPRHNKEARVLNEDGNPIPGLYAAGGLGTIWGFLTLLGGGLTDAMVFGRIAGRNAAREKPWM